METQAEVSLESPELPTGTYFGPATVLERVGSKLSVALPDRTVTAVPALGYPYVAEPGDIVLVAGAQDVYVIGVLKGRGRSLLQVPGDLEIRAGGRLRLVSPEQLDIASRRITLRSDRLETCVRRTIERISECYRWVSGLFQIVAGRTRTVVEGDATLHAGRIVEKSTSDVNIDGEQIRLG